MDSTSALDADPSPNDKARLVAQRVRSAGSSMPGLPAGRTASIAAELSARVVGWDVALNASLVPRGRGSESDRAEGPRLHFVEGHLFMEVLPPSDERGRGKGTGHRTRWTGSDGVSEFGKAEGPRLHFVEGHLLTEVLPASGVRSRDAAGDARLGLQYVAPERTTAGG